MARPVVLVYQETATVTVTPTIPELNCCVVGPAYWIQDYLDDKTACKVTSTYGTKNTVNTYVPPLLNTTAITLTDAPGNTAGAYVDSTSVKLYFDNCRVLIAQDVATGALVTETTPDAMPHNRIRYAACPAPFKTAMASAKAGDYVIIDDESSALLPIVKTIQSVDTTNFYIYCTTNFVTGQGHDANTQMLRVEREVNDILVSSTFQSVSGNSILVLGGATTTLTGESVARTIQYADVYIQYRSLRTDLADVGTVSSESDVIKTICNSSTDVIDARNPLAGCLMTALKNTTTPVQYYGLKTNNAAGHTLAQEDLEGRTDIYAVVPITEDLTILNTYGAQFKSLADPAIAGTTGIPQKWRVVLGAYALPTTKIVAAPDLVTANSAYIAGRHGSVSGAISGTPITTADVIDVFVDASATFVTDGVAVGDILVITNATGVSNTNVGSYTVAAVYDEQRLRIASAVPFPVESKAVAATYYYIIRGTGTPVASTTFTAGTSTLGSVFGLNGTVTMTLIPGLAAYAGKVLRITAPAGNAYDWLIISCTVATPGVATVDHATQVLAADVVGITAGAIFDTISSGINKTTAHRRPFRTITEAAATYSTSKVLAGDYLQVPNPITGTSFTTSFAHKIAYVANENLLVMDTNVDVVATLPLAGDVNLRHRVSRTLSKANQVTELVTISQSVKNRRIVLVWPNLATVSGLVDGSKTRTVSSTPEAANAQPGYYLAAVVGGMTAGLPSHQGFTNLSIAGISGITNSTRYFSDTQLTTISDGGWYVFGQTSTSSLPFCIHQLTTDPTTLESGEYSVVKNFDFVSYFFQDILDEFLGDYNINTDTLGLLQQALTTGIDVLKLRKAAKIGAPLNDAAITSLAQHATVRDRVEAYMTVNLPIPLNRIGLHLVSS